MYYHAFYDDIAWFVFTFYWCNSRIALHFSIVENFYEQKQPYSPK